MVDSTKIKLSVGAPIQQQFMCEKSVFARSTSWSFFVWDVGWTYEGLLWGFSFCKTSPQKKNMCSILKASKLPKKLMAEHPTNDGRYGRTWNFWNFFGILLGVHLEDHPTH